MKKKTTYDVIIIGAGASGLMAACELSKTTKSILILDRMDAPGKKILATGNGKCNMTNLRTEGDIFRGTCSPYAMYALTIMSPDKLRDYFYNLGLLTIERNGYVYPVTEQSKSVVNILVSALKKSDIEIHTGEMAFDITKMENKAYQVKTDKAIYQSSNVIMACGGKASPKLGSDGSGYRILKNMGIHLMKPLPALTALCSPRKSFKNLAGVRTKGCLSYFSKNGHFIKEQGEIQLAAYGISGIPVFQISRYVISDLEKQKECEVEFDFFPEKTFQDLKNILRDFRRLTNVNCHDILSGMVHEKWVPVLLGDSGINGNDLPDTVPEKKWNKLTQLLKQYPIIINGYRDFDFAQACQGGVRGDELTKELELTKYKGVYIVGELADVDGTCGGYNLHWAFTSGYMAAKSISHRLEKKG